MDVSESKDESSNDDSVSGFYKTKTASNDS